MEKQEKKTMKKNTGWNKFFIILTMIFTLDYLIWRIFLQYLKKKEYYLLFSGQSFLLQSV